MLTTVAAETGPDVFTLMDEPFWRVLYVFNHLEERRSRQSLRDRLARVDHGMMTALAFNQPALLADELQRVQEAITEEERGPAIDVTSLRTKAEALATRIEQGRVLSAEALVS